MRLTAELALDQIRGNRKRSAGAIMATALSSALLTAVMCFASTIGTTMAVASRVKASSLATASFWM